MPANLTPFLSEQKGKFHGQIAKGIEGEAAGTLFIRVWKVSHVYFYFDKKKAVIFWGYLPRGTASIIDRPIHYHPPTL